MWKKFNHNHHHHHEHHSLFSPKRILVLRLIGSSLSSENKQQIDLLYIFFLGLFLSFCFQLVFTTFWRGFILSPFSLSRCCWEVSRKKFIFFQKIQLIHRVCVCSQCFSVFLEFLKKERKKNETEKLKYPTKKQNFINSIDSLNNVRQ